MSVSGEDKIESIAPATHSENTLNGVETEVPLGATLYVGTGGDIVVDAQRDSDGAKTVFVNVPDGSVLPVRVKRIYGAADGTTAEDLVLIW